MKPVKYKPIAPNPATLPPLPGNDNALLLLKFPGGETIKLSNLPFVKCDSGQPTQTATVQNETKYKLQKAISHPSSSSSFLSTSSNALKISSSAPVTLPNSDKSAPTDEKDDLKERNRMSAQRSRLKKRNHMETLLQNCRKNQKDNEMLRTENKALRSENLKLKQLLAEHLKRSVSAGARDAIASKLINDQLSIQTHSITTQTSVVEQDHYDDGSYHDRYQKAPSPPQTQPQDLRVGTKIQNDEKQQQACDPKPCVSNSAKAGKISNSVQNIESNSSNGKKTKMDQESVLQSPMKKSKREAGAKRLKDKLSMMKKKLAEDQTTLSNIQSGYLR